MKSLKYIILLFTAIFLACEDEITVDLETDTPRLVIDASINWFKNTTGNEQQIQLSLTSSYYDTTVIPANNAQVIITDQNNNIFQFNEDQNTGIYKTINFIPELYQTYTLTIVYEGETYIASETLFPIASVDYVEQNVEGGFSGDETEIKAFYTDPEGEENYYFFEFVSDIPAIPTLEVYNDEFTNGNQIFAFYTEEELDSGDTLVIRNYGVSNRFYEFMFVLLYQNSEDRGGPFETQPATVRGNCINETNPDNFPFGYFRVSQADEFIYVVD